MENMIKYLVVAVACIGLALVIHGASYDWIAHQRADQAQGMIERARTEIGQAQTRIQQEQQAAQQQKSKFNECMDKVGKGEFKNFDECQKAASSVPPAPKPGNG